MLKRFKTNSFKSFLQAVTAPKFRGSTGLKCRFGVLGGGENDNRKHTCTWASIIPNLVSMYRYGCVFMCMNHTYIYIYIHICTHTQCVEARAARGFQGMLNLGCIVRCPPFTTFSCLQGRCFFGLSCSFLLKMS